MEVRRNPRTSTAVGRQTFAQAEQTDYRPLLQGAADLKAGLDASRRERQSFTLQKRLLEETNALQQDLEERRRDPNTDPTQLALDADLFYTGRVNAAVDEYREQGFDSDLVNQFFMGMGRVRNQLSDVALTYQQEALRGRAVSDVGQLLEEGTRQVVNNVDDYDIAASFIEDTINRNPDLTEEQREALISDVRPSLRAAAAQSWAMENPQSLIEQLDPDGRWRKAQEVPVTGSAASVVAALPETDPANRIVNYVAREANGISAVPDDVTTLGQLYAFQRELVRGNTRAGVPDNENSSAVGVYQIVSRTLQGYAEKLYGADWRDQPFDFTRQDEIARAIFEENNGSATALKNQWVSLTLQEAEQIRKQPWEEARKLIARKESSADLSDLVGQPERVPQSGDVQTIDLPASGAGQSSNLTEPAPQAELHPVLRDLSGDERLRLLQVASANIQKNTASQKAALDILIQNVKAEALANGQVASPIPADDEIMQVYGAVAGPQVISDLRQTVQLGQQLKTFAVMHPDQINAQVERLRPQPGSPTFATDNELFEAAQRAQEQILKQRAEDPAAYVLQNFPSVIAAAERGTGAYYAAMDRALESLGIDPTRTSPLPKAARDTLINQWPTMAPVAKREWFQDNFRTMGEARLKAFARGAEGTSMEEELRLYALLREQVPDRVIDEVFTGRDIIAKDPARRPSTEQVTQLFRRSNFNAVLSMAPDASAALQDAAAAIYAARGGRIEPTLDQEAYKKAVATALGGASPFNAAKGAVEDYTIPPRGTTEAQFTNWVEQLQPNELTNLSVEGLPPKYADLTTGVRLSDIIDDGVFVMWAPGLYRIRMASDGGYLKTETGRSFIVRLTPDVIMGRNR